MLQRLPPRLKEVSLLPPGIKMLDTTKKPWLKLEDIRTARWVKAKNGRLLPLNSAAWFKLRMTVLHEQPLCPECEARGIIEPATQVHHINDNAMDNSRDNLVALCASCHSKHTVQDMGGNARMGCAMDGTPLDHSHHWNNAATGQRSRATEGQTPSSESSFIANSESVA